jgi:acyl CoA:acetate/3-ketoacid CoA transferase beta subunit
MCCRDNSHFIKNCKLLSAVQSCIINVVSAETVKEVDRRRRTQKKVALAEVTAESVQNVIKAERSLKNR